MSEWVGLKAAQGKEEGEGWQLDWLLRMEARRRHMDCTPDTVPCQWLLSQLAKEGQLVHHGARVSVIFAV